MKHTITALALLALATLCQAEESTLPHLRKVYETRAREIEVTHSNAVATALRDYGSALEAAKESYRKQGELDGLLGAKKELERFEKEDSCHDVDPKDLPPLITAARSACRDACDTAVKKEVANLIELGGAYKSRLTALEKEYVIQEKLTAALGVRHEAERIEFVLSDMESRMPKPKVSPISTSTKRQVAVHRRAVVGRADFQITKGKDKIAVLRPDALRSGDRSYTFGDKTNNGLSFMPHMKLRGLKYVFRDTTYSMGPVVCSKSGIAYALTSHSGSSSQSKYILNHGFRPEPSLNTELYAVFSREFRIGESFHVPAKWVIFVF